MTALDLRPYRRIRVRFTFRWRNWDMRGVTPCAIWVLRGNNSLGRAWLEDVSFRAKTVRIAALPPIPRDGRPTERKEERFGIGVAEALLPCCAASDHSLRHAILAPRAIRSRESCLAPRGNRCARSLGFSALAALLLSADALLLRHVVAARRTHARLIGLMVGSIPLPDDINDSYIHARHAP